VENGEVWGGEVRELRGGEVRCGEVK